MTSRISIWSMATLYVAAGIAHFVWPHGFVRIVPAWVPDAYAAVLWSGIAEVVLGLALLIKPARPAAAIGIVVLLIAVFPANVQMAKSWLRDGHPAAWISVARLPLQVLLIWWAWKVRKL